MDGEGGCSRGVVQLVPVDRSILNLETILFICNVGETTSTSSCEHNRGKEAGVESAEGRGGSRGGEDRRGREMGIERVIGEGDKPVR